jgi:hypothetical protein
VIGTDCTGHDGPSDNLTLKSRTPLNKYYISIDIPGDPTFQDFSMSEKKKAISEINSSDI